MRIIAHRGASQEQPGNTLAAFDRALELGVDAIEADLLITKDGTLVVRHDDLIEHTGRWRYVHELTLKELRQIDVGAGQRILSLEQLLERYHRQCPIVLDLKTFGLVKPLVDILKTHDAIANIHVTSFLHPEIAELSMRCPEVDHSIVMAAMPISFELMFHDTGTRQVSVFRGYFSEQTAHRLRELGVTVWVYPVNLPREGEVFAAWGVDAVYTDDPAVMQPLRDAGP